MNGGDASEHPGEDVIVITGDEEANFSQPLMLLGSVGKAGYLLDDYYFTEDFSGSPVNSSTNMELGEEYIIYAKWVERIDFTVDLGDGYVLGTEPPENTFSAFAAKGTIFEDSVVGEHYEEFLIRDGFVVEGFYYDDAFTQPIDRETEVIDDTWENITIYVNWEASP